MKKIESSSYWKLQVEINKKWEDVRMDEPTAIPCEVQNAAHNCWCAYEVYGFLNRDDAFINAMKLIKLPWFKKRIKIVHVAQQYEIVRVPIEDKETTECIIVDD